MAEYIEKWPVVNRLIDIENEFQQYKPFHGFEHAMYRKICEAEIAIGKTQAADVAPVQYGQWECQKPCPVCGEDRFKGLDADIWSDWEPPYCPNCGAKMDEESINETD